METGAADAVVCTITLCSVPDQARSLAEMHRVLKPGGQLLFLEHVRSQTDSRSPLQESAIEDGRVLPTGTRVL